MRGRPELVPGQHEENVRRHLMEHLVQPAVLKRHRDAQQEHDDPREVDVAHDHDVEVAEQLELAQVDGGLAVDGARLLQVPDGPHDREQDAAAAQQVDEDEHVLPGAVLAGPFLALEQDDLRHVGEHLEGDDGHEEALVLGRQDVLYKCPARAD